MKGIALSELEGLADRTPTYALVGEVDMVS